MRERDGPPCEFSRIMARPRPGNFRRELGASKKVSSCPIPGHLRQLSHCHRPTLPVNLIHGSSQAQIGPWGETLQPLTSYQAAQLKFHEAQERSRLAQYVPLGPSRIGPQDQGHSTFSDRTSPSAQNLSQASFAPSKSSGQPTTRTGVSTDQPVSINALQLGAFPALIPSSTTGSLLSHDFPFQTSSERHSCEEVASVPDSEFPGPLQSTVGFGQSRGSGSAHPQRRPSNRDEFDGPHQYLKRLAPQLVAAQEQDLPHLPTNLIVSEQDDILSQVNDRLSQCAYDFVAKYQFPIPLEPDKRPVIVSADRGTTFSISIPWTTLTCRQSGLSGYTY